ncbi:MAG: hypothetical protein H6553_02735 [Chitinophagales bacterium]|nr:hypothetical protein [Chitinophagales bacterium]
MFDNIDIANTNPAKSARVMIIQPDLSEENWIKKDGLYYLSTSPKLNSIIDESLAIGIKNGVNIIVYPECSITKNSIVKLQKLSKENNLILIGGSQYYKDKETGKVISRSPIIINGSIFYTDKINPSPYETSAYASEGLSKGSSIRIFQNTSIGNFCVIICADYLKEDLRSKIPDEELDFLFVIAYQRDSSIYFNRLNSTSEESNNGLYCIYNNIRINGKADGNSSVFGDVHLMFLQDIIDKGDTDCKPKKKIFTLRNCNVFDYLIADFDLTNKKPAYAKNADYKSNFQIIESSTDDEEVTQFTQLIGHYDIRYEKIDSVFVEPKEFSAIENKLKENNIIFIIGDPGIGKTFTSVKLLKNYFNKGYKPIWFTGLEKEERKSQRIILDKFEIEPNSIIYFEDPFGRTVFERRDSLFTFLRPLISKASKINCKIIITSRRQVFEEFANESLTKDELTELKEELNVVKPSYESEKLLEIFRRHLEISNFKMDEKHKSIIEQEIQNCNIDTPFEIRDIILTSQSIHSTDDLLNIIQETKKGSVKSFAIEISNLKPEVQFIYLLIFFFGHRKEIFNTKIYDNYNVVNEYPTNLITIPYKDLLRTLTGHRLESYGKFSEYIRFSHPRYEEALVEFLLQYPKAQLITKNIFHTLNHLYEKSAIVDSIKRSAFKYPEVSVLLLNLINVSLVVKGRIAPTQMSILKLLGASLQFEINDLEKSDLLKNGIIDHFKLEELVDFTNTLESLEHLKNQFRILNSYSQMMKIDCNAKIFGVIDYTRVAKIIKYYIKHNAVVSLIKEVCNFNNNFQLLLVSELHHSLLLRLFSNNDSETRLELLELFDQYDRLLELVKFSNKFKRKVEWPSILKIICESINEENRIIIDQGAVVAFRRRWRNLLPVGIIKTIGNYKQGQPIYIVSESGEKIGMGLAEYPSDEVNLIIGQHSSNILSILGYTTGPSVVRSINKILLQEEKKRWLTIDKK